MLIWVGGAHHLSVLLSACGPLGAVPDAVCGVIDGVTGWTKDVAEAVQNPFRWLYHHSLGAPVPQRPGDPGWEACQADWSQPSCPKLIDQLKPSHIALSALWPRLYSAFAVSGIFIAATLCVLRVVRGVFDAGAAPLHLITGNVLRLLVAVGLLLSPSPSSSVLLGAMTWSAEASGHVATAAAGATASALGIPTDLGVAVGWTATVGFAHGGIGDFLVAVPILLAAIGFVYITALYLLRIIQLVFAVATAPIFVAVAVFEPRSRAVHWWIDLFTSAMLMPVILAVFGALTAGVAMQFLGGIGAGGSVGSMVEWVTRVLLACFAILGGVWMTGKAVHGLAWRGFSHGGLTGAVTAVSTSLTALPELGGAVGGTLRGARALPRLARAASAAAGASSPALATLPTGETEAIVGAAAAGHLGRFGVDQRPAPAAIGNFAAQPAASALLRDAGTRDAFNRVLSASVARFAGSAEGVAAVEAVTPASGELGEDPRVEAFVRAVAADPVLGNAVAGAGVAGLLHDQLPDLASILARRASTA